LGPKGLEKEREEKVLQKRGKKLGWFMGKKATMGTNDDQEM